MFLTETKLYTITGRSSGEPFVKQAALVSCHFRVTFVIPFVSTTLLFGTAELTENRPSAGNIFCPDFFPVKVWMVTFDSARLYG